MARATFGALRATRAVRGQREALFLDWAIPLFHQLSLHEPISSAFNRDEIGEDQGESFLFQIFEIFVVEAAL